MYFGREMGHYSCTDEKIIIFELDGRTTLMERIWEGVGRAGHLFLLGGFTEHEMIQTTVSEIEKSDSTVGVESKTFRFLRKPSIPLQTLALHLMTVFYCAES